MTDTLEPAPTARPRRHRRSTPRSPTARWPTSGTRSSPTRSWSTPTTSASSRSSSSAPAWPARRRRRRWPSSATRSRRSRSTTRRAGPTRSPPRAASTRRRTTAATATASTGCSTTRSRAATSAPARATSTAWPRCPVNIIDQMVAQGVPFAREYGGLLDNRSFGGAQVSRTFYARGQTGQQLLLGAYQQMARQVGLGNIKLWNRMELVDVVVDRRPLRRHRHPRPAHRRGQLAQRPRRRAGHRRLRQRLLPVDERHELQRHGGVAGPPQGRLLRQPVLHADPPDVHPAGRRRPVEAHADVGVAAQRRPGLGAEGRRRRARAGADPRGRARLLPRAAVPELRQPGPARHLVAGRQAGRRLRPRRRAAEERRQPRLRRRHRPARPGRRRGALREPVRDVRADHRREPVPTRRCASTRRRTTRWAGSGSTTS